MTEYRREGNDVFGRGDINKIRRAYIKDTNIEDALRELAGCEKLQRLTIMGCGSGDFFEQISAFKHLEELHIEKTYFDEIPDCVSELKELRSLSFLSCRVKRLPESIGRLPLIYFNARNNLLEDLPMGIASVPISSMDLSENKFEKFPEALAGMNGLVRLDISRNSIREIPDFISGITKISRLDATDNHIEDIPQCIADCRELSNLGLDRNRFTELPAVLLGMRRLQKIYFSENEIERIPDAFSKNRFSFIDLSKNKLSELPPSMGTIENIGNLNLSNNQFETIPEVLTGMKCLERLNINDNRLSSLEGLAEIRGLESFSGLINDGLKDYYGLMVGGTFELNDLRHLGIIGKKTEACRKLLTALGKARISEAGKRWFLDSAFESKNFEKWPATDKRRTLEGLAVPFKPLQSLMLGRLSEFSEADKAVDSLAEGSVVTVFGRTSMKKTELREKLKSFGIGYAAKYGPKVTHIIVGSMPKEVSDSDGEITAKLLGESRFTDFVNVHAPGFLIEQEKETADEEAESPMIANLRDLLSSKDDASLPLAMEMLKANGVPKSLVSELFLLQKTHAVSQVRTAIRKLLLANAPERYLPAVNDRLSFNPDKLKEYEIIAKFKKIEKVWGRDVCLEFSCRMFERFGKGLRYAITKSKAGEEWREKALSMVFSEGELNWNKALVYKDRRSHALEDQAGYGGSNSKTNLPVDLLDKEKVSSMILHNIKMKTLPASIGKFVDLETLDCSVNSLSELPKAITKLKNLKHLNLSNNWFEAFPAELKELDSLRTLDLRMSSARAYDEIPRPLKVPDDFKEALPDCEVLV
ncbi:leucine-rich repeat domain-containing protein [Fulvitalea axinellae]